MSQDRVMLLIDADNVSVDVMEQSVRLLVNQHGGVHLRRAYCTAESAVKHQAAFKRLGIKPMVNLAAGKNSTDIALAVDAVDLVLAERPDVVVIASSDSDFAPLVQRLRAKGCVVRGIGQLGKTGDETREVYDDYTVLEHRKPQGAAAGATSPARKAPAKSARGGATPARGQRSPAARTAAPKPVAAAAAPAVPEAAPAAPAQAAEPPPAAPAAAAASASTPARKTARKSAAKPAAKAADADEPKAAAKSARKTATKAAAKAAAKADAEAPGLAPAPAASAEAPASPARKGRSTRPKAAAALAGAVPAAGPVAEDAELAAQVLQTLAAPAPAPAPAPASEPAPALPPHEMARQILALLPELDDGSRLELRVASQRLREAGLLSRSGASTKLLGRFPELFELLPAGQPNYLRLRR